MAIKSWGKNAKEKAPFLREGGISAFETKIGGSKRNIKTIANSSKRYFFFITNTII
ncbi:MAG: hypothetical protein IIU30_07705 [Treponema sp.]|nr:hypothetical protein [Treponema sp.]MBQ2354270.1 hypothetical protein [Treponema sp.]MBQ5433319.1 hypothetical protein [Treponema sp.]MBQ5450414.1 hypothetical protein [Treponema sp.]